jgi:hypothetical protein
MSILPSSNAFLFLTRFATLLLMSSYHKLYINIQLEGVDSAGAVWQSRFAQNGMIRVIW